MFSWLKKFVKNPREIGSVAPSSPALGELMTGSIPSDARVLELGPGSGAITTYILQKISAPSRLTLLESDEELARQCQTKFPGITMWNADVEDALMAHTDTFDVILSGIPFAVMEKEKRLRVFQLIKERLSAGGQFIMFQYSISTRDELASIFGTVTTKFTPWNVPPAFVFVAKNEKRSDEMSDR